MPVTLYCVDILPPAKLAAYCSEVILLVGITDVFATAILKVLLETSFTINDVLFK